MFNRDQFILEWLEHFEQPTGYEHQVVFDIEGEEVKLVGMYYAYKKKEDFIFSLINDKKVDAVQLEQLYNEMRWDERSDYDIEMVEVAWRFEAMVHQNELPMKYRFKILRKFIPFLRDFLKNGYGGPSPSKDVLLTAFPHGLKDYNDWSEDSKQTGARQRSNIAKMMGFGPVKECGWMFGLYDDEGKIHPL
jgi:hypothetical protein